MPYVIAEPCIGVKDATCLDVCPVDCIYDATTQYVIHPGECIDCAACLEECPVDAIYFDEDVPPEQRAYVQLNAELAVRIVESGPSIG